MVRPNEEAEERLAPEPLLPEEQGEDFASSFLSYTKQYKWLLLVIVLQTVTIFCAVIGYQALFPLKEKVPVYIGLNMEDNRYVYKLMPIEDIKGREGIAKFFMRQFIEDWGTVDRVDEEARVERIYSMSSDQVFAEFKAIRDGKGKDSRDDQEKGLRDDKKRGLHHIPGFKREIKILRDAHIASRGRVNFHEIDFQTIDTNALRPGEQSSDEWNAKIAYVFQPMKIHLEEDGSLLNPAGITVLECTITHREKIQ